MRLLKNPLPVVFFTIFLDMLGFGILIPVIPLLLADPQSPYFLLLVGYSLKNGYILLGFLLGIYPLMQFLATPILGQLSDKYGRKRILIISLAGTCLSYLLFAAGIITKNIPLLFASRALDGITGGNISVAQAAIADVTKPEDRAKNFGLIGAAFGLGFIIGPYLGGKLSDPMVMSWFNAATPFWFAAVLSFLNILSVVAFFPETLKKLKADLKIKFDESIKNIIRGYNNKKLRVLFITTFLFQSGFTFFTTFFSVFLIQRFMFTQGNIGDFFAYVGLWIALTQVIVTRRLAYRFGEVQILRVSLIGTGLAILLYFFPQIWWQLLLVVPLFAIFTGLTQANLTAQISRSAGPGVQGEVLGINASVQALAQAFPPVLSGYIAALVTPQTPIYLSAIVIVLAGVVFIFFYKPKTNTALL